MQSVGCKSANAYLRPFTEPAGDVTFGRGPKRKCLAAKICGRAIQGFVGCGGGAEGAVEGLRVAYCMLHVIACFHGFRNLQDCDVSGVGVLDYRGLRRLVRTVPA